MPARRLTSSATLVALSAACFVVACGGRSPTAAKPAPAQPAAIFIDSASLTLAVGMDHQLVATAIDKTGAPVSESVSWNSTNAAVVTVTQTGLVHGVTTGSATITAVVGPHIATSKVTVVATQ